MIYTIILFLALALVVVALVFSVIDIIRTYKLINKIKQPDKEVTVKNFYEN